MPKKTLRKIKRRKRRKLKRKRKVRAPRIFKDAKGFYIKFKGKKIRIKAKPSTKEKTIKKELIRSMPLPNAFDKSKAKARVSGRRGRRRNIRDPNLIIQRKIRADAQKELTDKLRIEKFLQLAKAEKERKEADEKLKRLEEEKEKRSEREKQALIPFAPPIREVPISGIPFLSGANDTIEVDGVLLTRDDIRKGLAESKLKSSAIRNKDLNLFENRLKDFKVSPALAKSLGVDAKVGGRPYKDETLRIISDRLSLSEKRNLNMIPEEDFDSALRRLIPKIKGAGKGDGITNYEIDDIMKEHPEFMGTVSADQIDSLGFLEKARFVEGDFEKTRENNQEEGVRGGKPPHRFGFIVNTDDSSGPGKHWVAVYIDTRTDKSIEYYDSLAEEPTKQMLKSLKKLVDRISPNYYLKLKINKIRNQSKETDTCGYHAMRFLKERFAGNKFKFSTGYTDLKEDEAKKFKKQLGSGYKRFF